MAFYDTKLSNCIEYAFQALALDERRSSFSPAVWEKPPGNHTVFPPCSLILPTTLFSFLPPHVLPYRNMDKTDLLKTLRQVWFPGVHSNIGGGYDDQQLANITLAWMMSQLEPFLDMRLEYVLDQDEENARYYRKEHQRIRSWSFGESTFSPLSPLSVAPTSRLSLTPPP